MGSEKSKGGRPANVEMNHWLGQLKTDWVEYKKEKGLGNGQSEDWIDFFGGQENPFNLTSKETRKRMNNYRQ